MDKKTVAILVSGLLVTVILFFVNIYLAGIAFIVVIAIVMSMMIMQDTTCMPQLDTRLREDAKAIVIRNGGNAPALRVHVALVPLDIEYDVPSIAVDSAHEHPLASMLKEVKAVVSYENEKGQSFSQSWKLSATEEPFEPLKPMIPLFGYK